MEREEGRDIGHRICGANRIVDYTYLIWRTLRGGRGGSGSDRGRTWCKSTWDAETDCTVEEYAGTLREVMSVTIVFA